MREKRRRDQDGAEILGDRLARQNFAKRIKKGAQLSSAIVAKGGKSYAQNRKRRQIDKGAK